MSKDLIEQAALLIDAVRKHSPLIDCITNYVTVNDCANILLSFGASPAMVNMFDDSFAFAKISGALYINTGTYIKEHETAGVEAALKRHRLDVNHDPQQFGPTRPHADGVVHELLVLPP